MQILRSADYRHMPWKNGKGETVEIAVFPPSASVDDFGWRISMAPVVANGPFSAFDGIDRTLSILTGEGMLLSVEGMAPALLDCSSAPFSFSGDAKTEAELQEGPITDLNVMTRRGHFSHRVTRIAQAGEIRFPADAVLVIVVVIGNANLAQVGLNSLDAMILENAVECGGLRIETLEPYFVIEIVALASD